jgi:hypothetical protein
MQGHDDARGPGRLHLLLAPGLLSYGAGANPLEVFPVSIQAGPSHHWTVEEIPYGSIDRQRARADPYLFYLVAAAPPSSRLPPTSMPAISRRTSPARMLLGPLRLSPMPQRPSRPGPDGARTLPHGSHRPIRCPQGPVARLLGRRLGHTACPCSHVPARASRLLVDCPAVRGNRTLHGELAGGSAAERSSHRRGMATLCHRHGAHHQWGLGTGHRPPAALGREPRGSDGAAHRALTTAFSTGPTGGGIAACASNPPRPPRS